MNTYAAEIFMLDIIKKAQIVTISMLVYLFTLWIFYSDVTHFYQRKH